MKREEFLKQLEQLLDGISEEEKADALAFYRSYFEDAGEENEESVIAELESPEKVAQSIKKNLGMEKENGFYGMPADQNPEWNKNDDDMFVKSEEVPKEKKGGWIPASEAPKTGEYILLSFENCSVPMVGRYEEDKNGGAFYIGDEDEKCVEQDIFVNAWMPLPEPYSADTEKPQTNADRIRSMTDKELAEWITNMCEFERHGEPYKSIYNLDTDNEEEIHDSYGDLLSWLKAESEE